MADVKPNIRVVFCGALDQKSAEERAEYLDAACGGDAELRARIEVLLDAHRDAGAFSEANRLVQMAPVTPSWEGPGTVIDRYKLLQEIGEGGFGMVYMAEQQEPVMRKVALKIIKLGMDTRQVIARFEAERQALAMMDHPNIAKVHDGGATDTGRPYFVMELVRGIPITEYCDKNNLTTNERLMLFVDVCSAVQHAHQKGIIHRDIKPTNVMITLRDGTPIPKVIDFGIAKATEHRLTEKTLYTDYHQFIGTPQYMSPEQATMSERDVDTRTDVYSLGVLLYELLVGSTPFQPQELREVGHDEICRIIRENDPPMPSRRLSTLGEAATTEVSRHRQAQPATLRRLLRGDLDWIVMKALEKDRTRRYDTAKDFAADVERYLTGEAVEARHPSTAYTFGKFARRNRAILTAVTFAAAALFIGTVVSILFAVSATIERDKAEGARRRAEDASQRESDARCRAEDLRYVSDMTRAEQARRDQDLRLVHQLLRAHHPSADGVDRRGWEWRYLWRACRDPVPTLRHDHIVSPITISPDGRWLVSGDAAGNLDLWDVSTGKRLDSTKAHRSFVWNVEFSPDGVKLASTGAAGPDSFVRLWRIDPVTPRLVKEADLAGDAAVIAFSDDGRLVASCGLDRVIRLWDVSTRQMVQEIPNGGPFGLAFGPSGNALAAHCGGNVTIWQLPYDADEPPWVIPGYDNITWTGLAFSPNGHMLAASWRRSGVDLWSLSDRKPLHRLATSANVHSVAFSPDSETIAVGQENKTVTMWNTKTGEKVDELTGHSGAICCVCFTPDGRTLASSSLDKTVRLSPLIQGQRTHRPRDVLRHHSKPVEAVAFSSDGQWLATGERRSTATEPKVVLWDANTWEVVREFPGKCFAFSPDSRHLAVSDEREPVVRLWDLHAGRDASPYAGTVAGDALAFAPDGKMAVGGEEGTLVLWEPDRKKVVASYDASSSPLDFRPQTLLRILFSPDGRTLATTYLSEDIALLDGRTLKVLQRYKPEELEFWARIAFSPDGHYWVTPDYDHTVKVWDVRDGKLELFETLRGHTDSATCAAFSRDGVLAVGCANGQVKLWDSSTWTERATLKCHDMAVRAVCFSPDGSTLVTGSDDTTVRIHRAATPEEITDAEREGVDPLRVELWKEEADKRP